MSWVGMKDLSANRFFVPQNDKFYSFFALVCDECFIWFSDYIACIKSCTFCVSITKRLHLANLTIMLKKTFLIILLIIAGKITHAQTADEVYEKYTDFNLAMLQNEHDKALDLGQQILPDSAKLSPKVRISFYNGIAKLYEDDSQSVKAIEYYNRVAAAQPDYYVAHRALGYLYIKDVSGKPAGEVVADAAYIDKVKKALPHLEKAQACDPDDETLKLIKTLYGNIKDEKGLNSLPRRLDQLKKNCIDILDTQ